MMNTSSLSQAHAPQTVMSGRLGYFLAACFALLAGLIPLAHMRGPQSILISLCALGALFVAARHFRYTLAALPPLIAIPLVVWTLIATASYLWSVEPANTFQFLARDVWAPALCFVVACLVAPHVRYRKWAAIAICCGFVVLSIAALTALATAQFEFLHQGATDTPASQHLVTRWYPGPGLASCFVLLAFPVVAWARLQGLIPRYFTWLLMLALLAAGATTFNRIFWPCLLAVVLVALVASLFSGGHRIKRRSIAILLTVLTVTSLTIPLVATMFRLNLGMNQQGLHKAVKIIANDPRFGIWHNWIDAGQQRLLTGTGFGKEIARRAYAPQLEVAVANGMEPMGLAHPHNLFLGAWIQTGLFGALALFGLMLGVAATGIRMLGTPASRSTGIALLALLAALVFKNVTDDFYDKTMVILFWSYAGLIAGSAMPAARADGEA